VSSLNEFLAHIAITAIALWLATFLFHGLSFKNTSSILISALLLGLANAVIKPIVILLTIPLTLITFGFFLLVINALMMMLVSSIVDGFKVQGFWTTFFASIFISILSFVAGLFIFQSGDHPVLMPTYQPGLII